MKPNILMKIAVVLMAAFGAYAFSGSNATNEMEPYSIKEGKVCTNILAECSDSGNFSCSIIKDGIPQNVLGFECTNEIKHEFDQDVRWEPINL